MCAHLSTVGPSTDKSTPKVTVVYTGTIPLRKQDYPNYEIVGGQTEEPAGLFNEYIRKGFEPNSIVGFISHEYNLARDDAITLMVSKLGKANIIGSVYADLTVKSKNSTFEKQWKDARQYLPAFHANLLKGELIVMSPVFMKANLLTTQRFNPMLKRLYHALFFLTISQNILGYHIPLPLYERYHIQGEGASIEEDYRYIKRWLTQLDM